MSVSSGIWAPSSQSATEAALEQGLHHGVELVEKHSLVLGVHNTALAAAVLVDEPDLGLAIDA